jgi:methyl-accepting chemotaxis protein
MTITLPSAGGHRGCAPASLERAGGPGQHGPADLLEGASRSFRDALARVEGSERAVDHAVSHLSRGGDLSAEELLALQARVYRASQQAELVSKAVDRVSDTVREITQIRV